MTKQAHSSTGTKKLRSEPDLLEFCNAVLAGPMRSQKLVSFFWQCLLFRAMERKKETQSCLLTFQCSEGPLLLRISNQKTFHSVLAGRTGANTTVQFPPHTELKDTAPSTQHSRMKRSLHTLCVVHAQRVVIDCRLPKQCVIGIVSAMRTEECIRYKMVSHSPWSSQETERDRKLQKETRAQREQRERER